MTSEPLLLRIDEAARRLSIGRSKTYELLRAGVIPSVRIGRSRRVPAHALEVWIEQQLDGRSAMGTVPQRAARTDPPVLHMNARVMRSGRLADAAVPDATQRLATEHATPGRADTSGALGASGG